MSDLGPGTRRGDAEQPLQPDEPRDDPDAGSTTPGEPLASMTDEAAELAERLAADLSRVLGTGVIVEDLELDGEHPVRVRVVCLIEGSVREIAAEGATLAEALNETVRAAAQMRLDAAWWQIVGPT